MTTAPRRPPVFPPPQFPPPRLPAFARMPPAVFPAVMGLYGLGLGLRRVPGAAEAADLMLGAVVTLWAFAAAGYLAKAARRPGVVAEDLRVLPGRAGLAAGSLGALLAAAALAPFAPGSATALMAAGLALHGLVVALVLRALWALPPEGRGVTPVFHLTFVGFIIGGLPATALGHAGLAAALFWAMLPVAVAIWGVSLWQLLTRIPPAPLRPLLAIHLAPASLLGLVAAGMGMAGVATAFAALGAAMLLALAAAGRWITGAGFSPLWAAFTFPLAAWAGLALTVGWTWPGLAALAAAAVLNPWVAWRVLRMWADGSLAARTNAATA
ncbi:MAG TPA: tellurium resistance protein [Paracoccaceae bacterium]|nr:tellurium resistance protein [Paracoccaceae bacterium]